MTTRPEEVFDWAQHWPEQQAEVEPYRPPIAPALVPPIPAVVERPGQQPYYAHIPAQVAPFDPLPARMAGCGVLAFGVGGGAGIFGLGAGVGCYWFFKGMALATDAIIGTAVALGFVAVALVAVKAAGGVRISNFHQGDGASFRVGR